MVLQHAADAPLRRLVELAPSRWPIYVRCQGRVRLGSKAGAGRIGHLALVMLAYSFLARQCWTRRPGGLFPPQASGRPSWS